MVEHARRALMLGISTFGDQDEYSDLPFCPSRMRELNHALGNLGYSCVTPPSDEIHSDRLGDTVREAIRDSRAAAVIVHVLSHGCVSDRTNSLYVVGGDGRRGPGTSVEQWLTSSEDFDGPHVLFLLDLCHAGAAARLPWQLETADSSNRTWVIGAASSQQEAFNGRFTQAVSDVLQDIFLGRMDIDSTVQYVPLPVVARAIDRRVRKLRDQESALHQEVTCTVIDIKHARDLELPFFPNVHYQDSPMRSIRRTVDPAIGAFIDEALDVEHFVTRASGHGPFADVSMTGMFHGRVRQLRDLSGWLDSDEASLRLVTGSPGVGKSALLGVLLCAAHPVLSEHTHHLWSRVAHAPSVHERLAAVHLRQRDLEDVLESVAHQLALDPPSTGRWTSPDLIGALRDLPSPAVLILDALDEAIQPLAIQAVLLLPLVNARRTDGSGVVKLLVGVRPWEEFLQLREAAANSGGLVDLDGVPPGEVETDLRSYAEDLLRVQPGYRAVARREVRHLLAAELAARLTHSRAGSFQCGAFLVAGLFLHHLATNVAPATDVDMARRLGAGAPVTLADLMELDLRARMGVPGIRAVLAALAHARGDGMPASLIANAGSGFEGDSAAVKVALTASRFYLRHSADSDGVMLYRLFHQGLADYLRSHPDTPAPKTVFERLHATVQPNATVPSWSSAEPYLLRYIASHATEAGVIDVLLVDAEYLVHADPTILLRELTNADSPAARSAAAVYRRSIGRHGIVTPQARREILMVDAARYGDRELAAAFAGPGDHRAVDLWPRWCTGAQAAPALRATLGGHHRAVNAVSLTTASGRSMAVTGGMDRTLRIWDLDTGHQVGSPLTGHTGEVTAVDCTVIDNRAVAVSVSMDCSLRMWVLATGHPVHEPIVGHNDSVNDIACVVLDGVPTAFTVGVQDIRAWNLADRVEKWNNYVNGWVNSVTHYERDGEIVVVTAGDDNTVRQWDPRTGAPLGYPIATGEPRHSKALRPNVVNTISVVRHFFSAGSLMMLVGKADGTLQVWDMDTRAAVSDAIAAHQESVTSIDITEMDGQLLAMTGGDDGARLWELPGLRPAGLPMTGHEEWVRCAAFVRAGGELTALTGSGDSCVRMWNLVDEYQLRRPLPGPDEFLQAIAVIDVDGRSTVVSGGNDRVVRTWELLSGREIGESFRGHSKRVLGLTTALLDGHPVVLSASNDCTVRVWDLMTRAPVGKYESTADAPFFRVAAVQFDGRLLAAAGGVRGSVEVWDVASGEAVIPPIDDQRKSSFDTVDCGLLEGRPVVVTGNTSTVVQMWDMLSGQRIGEPLLGLAKDVRAVKCLDLDGQLTVIAGSSLGQLMAWDGYSRRPLIVPDTGDTGMVEALACTEIDGQMAIVSPGLRGVYFWQPGSTRIIRHIQLPGAASAVAVANNGDIVVAMGWEILVLTRDEFVD